MCVCNVFAIYFFRVVVHNESLLCACVCVCQFSQMMKEEEQEEQEHKEQENTTQSVPNITSSPAKRKRANTHDKVRVNIRRVLPSYTQSEGTHEYRKTLQSISCN